MLQQKLALTSMVLSHLRIPDGVNCPPNDTSGNLSVQVSTTPFPLSSLTSFLIKVLFLFVHPPPSNHIFMFLFKLHVKFQRPRTTLSGRKVTGSERQKETREEEEKMLVVATTFCL